MFYAVHLHSGRLANQVCLPPLYFDTNPSVMDAQGMGGFAAEMHVCCQNGAPHLVRLTLQGYFEFGV